MRRESTGLEPRSPVDAPRRPRTPALHAAGSLCWRIWSGPLPTRAARTLCAAGVGLLFLEATATVELVYTIRASYVLLAVACLVGAPLVVDGWRRVPAPLRLGAGALVAAYFASALVGTSEALPGQARTQGHRDLVYMSDLVLGLAAVGLIVGCSQHERFLGTMVAALLAGAGVASLYAIYQWPAQHFGWPLNDVNNALNTTGLSRGSISSGTGVLGWARVRGTFREPHLLATFIALALPLCALLLPHRSRRVQGAIAGVVVVLVAALLLTLSASSWAIFGFACLIVICLSSIATGRIPVAALSAGAAVVVALVIPLLLVQPQHLTSLTGRDAVSVEISTRSRTDAWIAAVDVWSSRPVLGYGPGQSAVRLAGVGDHLGGLAGSINPTVLGSAHGVPMAALVDVGVIGFALWLFVLGTVLAHGVQALLRRPAWRHGGLLAAASVGVLAGLVGGDRIELVTWVILGALVAASLESRGQTRSILR